MTDQADREMIEARLSQLGLTADRWDMAGEDGVTAYFDNVWYVVVEDESRGLYDGDSGKVHATVVGAERYHNQRVVIHFVPEGNDSGDEVEPFVDVESV